MGRIVTTTRDLYSGRTGNATDDRMKEDRHGYEIRIARCPADCAGDSRRGQLTGGGQRADCNRLPADPPDGRPGRCFPNINPDDNGDTEPDPDRDADPYENGNPERNRYGDVDTDPHANLGAGKRRGPAQSLVVG